MYFTEAQTKALSAKLAAKHVRTREHSGRTLSYVEGWHAIAEANRIFGFDGWDRETISATCVWHGTRNGQAACTYVARVRIAGRVASSSTATAAVRAMVKRLRPVRHMNRP